MNNLLNLFIVLGLCLKFSFSLQKERKNNVITCGQLKINPRVETMLRLRKHSRADKTIGFTWTVFISKKDSRQKELEFEEGDDYYDYDNFEDNLLCKGFLIHPQVVITTARCIQEFLFTAQKDSEGLKNYYKDGQRNQKFIQKILLENIEIRNGGWIPLVARPLVHTTPPLIHEQIRYISNMTIHPNYNCSSMENNHALLLLSEGFDMSKPDIGVLCLSDTEELTLQCQDVYNIYSSDVEQSKLCGTEYNLLYKEKFLICPKDLDDSDKYYYSGIYRYLLISSLKEKKSKKYYDSFVGNIDWVQSFLYENGVKDTLYKI